MIVGDEQLDQIGAYVEMLLEWNRKVNLISRRDEENIWTNHLLHSISVLFKLSFPAGLRIVDFGTGGGLPGIPLAILLADSHFLLIDATQKKIRAVEEMTAKLQLSNVTTRWGRGEELSREPGLVGIFDLVIARAVAPLEEIVRFAGMYLRQSSQVANESLVPDPGKEDRLLVNAPHIIVYKGGNTVREIDAAKRLKGVEGIREIPLTFDGSAESGLVDKKIVLVHFKR